MAAFTPSMEKKSTLAGIARMFCVLPCQTSVFSLTAQVSADSSSKLRLFRCHSSNSRYVFKPLAGGAVLLAALPHEH
jgi:hypothetical protein